jgi:hypothetical protein
MRLGKTGRLCPLMTRTQEGDIASTMLLITPFSDEPGMM